MSAMDKVRSFAETVSNDEEPVLGLTYGDCRTLFAEYGRGDVPLIPRPDDSIPTMKEAGEILRRFVHSHFRPRLREGDETARFSIPANPRRDDDLRMSAFIGWARRVHDFMRRLDDFGLGEMPAAFDREMRALIAEVRPDDEGA